MHANDPALEPGHRNPEGMPSSPASDATSRTDAALASARNHFIARGWRPMAIRPPGLETLCADVSMLLLMNDAGATAWLSARDWSALTDPVEAFRLEMTCVRDARVDQTILVHDGDFPEAVVEVAAREPSLKLIDAAALRAMSSTAASPVAAAALSPTRRQRLAGPARQAAHYLAQVRVTRPVAAAERYFHDRFANRLRRLNDERRRLKTLSTALLVLAGASLGFFAFNVFVMMQAPEANAIGLSAAQANVRPLPQPMAPSQGYVAQAAGVSGATQRSANASSAYRLERAPAPAPSVDTASISDGSQSSLAMVRGGAVRGYEDVELTQRRADEAMRVIAGSTREVRTASPAAASVSAPTSVPTSVPMNRSAPDVLSVHPVDPAMADGGLSRPDPASVD